MAPHSDDSRRDHDGVQCLQERTIEHHDETLKRLEAKVDKVESRLCEGDVIFTGFRKDLERYIETTQTLMHKVERCLDNDLTPASAHRAVKTKDDFWAQVKTAAINTMTPIVILLGLWLLSMTPAVRDAARLPAAPAEVKP